jgi:hypothetical protein
VKVYTDSGVVAFSDPVNVCLAHGRKTAVGFHDSDDRSGVLRIDSAAAPGSLLHGEENFPAQPFGEFQKAELMPGDWGKLASCLGFNWLAAAIARESVEVETADFRCRGEGLAHTCRDDAVREC